MTAIIRRTPTRALAVVEPFYQPRSLVDDIDLLGRKIWNAWRPARFITSFYPRLDIYEEKDVLVIRAELSGVKREELNISLESDMLTIEAEKKPEEVGEDVTYYSYERCFGCYSRCVSLPFPVDASKVSATLENGLLEIRLPKAEEAPTKHIEIKVQ